MVKRGWLNILWVITCLNACDNQGPTAASGDLSGDAQVLSSPEGREEAITIYRDRYGTPQVFAETNYGVYYGYGYAVATDRLFQMEMLKRTAQGRVADVLGPDYLELDIKLRTEYNHPTVRAQVAALSNKDLAILNGYASGFNARLDELMLLSGEPLPKPFYDYQFRPSRWTAYDVAAIFVGSIAHRYADFNSERDNLEFLQAMEERHGVAKGWGLFNTVKWLRDHGSPTTVPRGEPDKLPLDPRPKYLDGKVKPVVINRIVYDDAGKFAGLSGTTEGLARHRQQIASSGYGSHAEFSPASNYWAMSGLSDAPGALLNGPQFGFALPSYVYGIGLHGGDFDVVGNTLLALPSLLFAHNNAIAWGSTAGISDQTDEFWLVLNPDNAEQYWHKGDWRTFESWPEVIKVAGAETITVTARRSVHGMVLDHSPDKGLAWARARAWEGQAVQDLMAWVWLATDQTLEAADRRLEDKTTNINMYTLDKTGRLGYVHSGKYPKRAAGHDPRLPAPGDGSMDWQGMRPYADNPRLIDPEQGYIVNWNNRPSEDWISSDLWSYTWSRADRVHILIDELESLTGGSVAEMVAINTRSAFEDVNHRYLLPRLRSALVQQNLSTVEFAAMTTLFEWDKSWRVDDAGFYKSANAIMEAFVRLLQSQVFLDDVGKDEYFRFAATNYPNHSLGPSLGTSVAIRALVHWLDVVEHDGSAPYDLLNGSSIEDVLVLSFREAVAELMNNQGADPKQWRLSAAPMVWRPVNFRGVPQADPSNVLSLSGYQNRGSENNVFVATGSGIEARDVNPPGQGGHWKSSGEPEPHRDDQLTLYSEFGYKALPFKRQAVAAGAKTVRELKVMRPR
jgi:penicillin amidase